jgi:outer membrane lipoprotein-sorting protein
MKQKLFGFLILTFVMEMLVFAQPAAVSYGSDQARQSERDYIITRMKEREKSLKTLTARFVQTKKNALLKEPLQSEGAIYYEAADKMLFKITRPSSVVVLVKSRKLLTYYPDLKRWKERFIGNNILKEYFGIGRSVEDLSKQYAIEILDKSATGIYRLQLHPKIKVIAKRIETIEIEVTEGRWLPELIYFKEIKGNYTSIRLKYTSLNQPLPAGIFSITLPDQRYDNI